MQKEKYKITDRDYFFSKFKDFINEQKLNETLVVPSNIDIEKEVKQLMNAAMNIKDKLRKNKQIKIIDELNKALTEVYKILGW